MIRKIICGAGAVGTTLFASSAAFAQAATAAASTAASAVASAAAAPVATATAAAAPALVNLSKMSAAAVATAEGGMMNKGDNAWMLVSTALVLMMSIPGLALFYGGLVRTKNMLSVLMQVFMIISICSITWCLWGYSMAFSTNSYGPLAPYVGGLS